MILLLIAIKNVFIGVQKKEDIHPVLLVLLKGNNFWTIFKIEMNELNVDLGITCTLCNDVINYKNHVGIFQRRVKFFLTGISKGSSC